MKIKVFLLLAIFLISHVQGTESNKTEEKTAIQSVEEEDCPTIEGTLVGLLTVGIILYYMTLPVFWGLGWIFGGILGPLYPYLEGIFEFLAPGLGYMYLVGLIVPKEEILPKINTAMERTFAPQVVEYL